MAVLKKEDFLAKIQAIIGEDTSDDALSFIEDMTDTFNELENKGKGDGEDWKTKYDDLDKTWRKKYQDRFFNNNTPPANEKKEDFEQHEETDEQKEAEAVTFDDLFTDAENGSTATE